MRMTRVQSVQLISLLRKWASEGTHKKVGFVALSWLIEKELGFTINAPALSKLAKEFELSAHFRAHAKSKSTQIDELETMVLELQRQLEHWVFRVRELERFRLHYQENCNARKNGQPEPHSEIC